jgi:hypothetical protein
MSEENKNKARFDYCGYTLEFNEREESWTIFGGEGELTTHKNCALAKERVDKPTTCWRLWTRSHSRPNNLMTPITRRSFTSRVVAALAGLFAGLPAMWARTPNPYRGVLDDEGREWHEFVVRRHQVVVARPKATGIRPMALRDCHLRCMVSGGGGTGVEVLFFDQPGRDGEAIWRPASGLRIYRLEHGREVLFWPKEGV